MALTTPRARDSTRHLAGRAPPTALHCLARRAPGGRLPARPAGRVPPVSRGPAARTPALPCPVRHLPGGADPAALPLRLRWILGQRLAGRRPAGCARHCLASSGRPQAGNAACRPAAARARARPARGAASRRLRAAHAGARPAPRQRPPAHHGAVRRRPLPAGQPALPRRAAPLSLRRRHPHGAARRHAAARAQPGARPHRHAGRALRLVLRLGDRRLLVRPAGWPLVGARGHLGGGLAVFATPFLPPDQQLANVLTFGGNYGTDALRSTRWRTDLLLLLLLSGLYIIQTIYFVVVLGAVLVHRVLQQRRVLAAVLLVVAVIGIAWMEGGLLFTRLPDPAPRGLAFRFWLGAQGLPVLFWQLLVFGALLPLGLVGLRRARGGRWLFSAYLGACLAAGNFFYYTYSWDIVKFFAVAMPVLGILSGAPLAWLWQRTRIGLVLVAVVLTATSVAYCAAVIWLNVPRPRYDHYLTQQIPRLTPDERGAMIWLHERRRPQDIVAWTGPEASVIAYLSGLSMAGPLQWQGTAFGVSPERIERRAALLDQGATNIPMLRAEGVRWYVTDPDPGSSFARACAATGPSCQLAHRQGIFAIYDLKAE